MLHVEELKRASDGENLVKQATGRYYTGDLVGRKLAEDAASAYHEAWPSGSSIRVLDPFGGDGRLAEWLIEAWCQFGFPEVQWDVTIWDIDEVGFDAARLRFRCLAKSYKANCRVRFRVLDTFSLSRRVRSNFDIVITNPPWELLKPDRRELKSLSATDKAQYVARLRAYDEWLANRYPLSQPRRKFAGWGTNLSRVGLEVSLSLVRPGGMLGAVLPASILADDQTVKLREHLFIQHSLESATYYPAEAKLYGSADVASVAIVLATGVGPTRSLAVASYDVNKDKISNSILALDHEALHRSGYAIPISIGVKAIKVAQDLARRFPSWLDLESTTGKLWAGREIDETDIGRWLDAASSDAPLFVKGRMINRFSLLTGALQSVRKPGWSVPISTRARRIGWRDVSRPSQKRRMIATLIEPGFVAGNSVGVAYFKDLSERPLLALLGVVNSTCFELQLRAHLATSHVSLSSLRKVAVPGLAQLWGDSTLVDLVKTALHALDSEAVEIDAYVARRVYRLSEKEYRVVLESFNGFSIDERRKHLRCYRSWVVSESRDGSAASGEA